MPALHPEDAKRIGNWRWRLTHLPRIQTKKAGVLARFLPKVAQKKISRWFGLWHRFIVLKARQVGISTLFLLWHLDATMLTPNTTTCILAHNRETLHRLFRIIKIAYEAIPAQIRMADGGIWAKPTAKYDTKNELYFEGLNSRIYVALKVRSDTIHRLHVSEAAHIEHAEEVLTATLGAVPDDGIVSIESTANGMGGLFFELWEAAAGGESQYVPFFIGYQDDPDYCDQLEDPAAFEKTLTAEERQLVARDGLTLGNVAWRRRQLSDPAKRKKFAQEFPANAEEAFLTTGRSPFDRAKIKDWIIREPIEKRMEGRLLYWIKPVAGRRYLVVCDAASGRGIEALDEQDQKEGGTDYDVVQVIDCETLQVCAMFRGKWPYSKLHHIIYDLGMEYGKAYVVVEATDHGLTVLNNLTDHTAYPKEMIHSVETVDEKSKRVTKKWGFYTNAKTKPLVLDKLAEVIDDELLRCYSRKVQSECLRFIIDENGEMHAMEGYHDDTVMALAIGVYCVPHALRAGRMTASKKELGLTGM